MKNKKIALIAHNRRKQDMVEWAEHNASTLLDNDLYCTGTTGKLIEEALHKYVMNSSSGFKLIRLTKFNSGPMGGDAQIAALVATGEIDICIFLIDDLSANPHEADIQMLLRQCRIHNIPVACNRHSADLMITSDLWGTDYTPKVPQYIEFER